MKYRTLRFFLPSLAVAFLMCACQVEEPQSPELSDGDENIIPVAVSLKLNVAGEGYGTPQTKAIDDPTADNPAANVQSTQIKNMVVLQYNGTGDDATLVGDVHYLDSTVDPDDEHYLDMTKIKLAASMGETHTLVFLTNTFTEIRAGETLGEMLGMWRETGGEADVFGHTGDSHELDPAKDYYQRMNAIAVTTVDEGTEVYGTLRRSMARINVEIINSGADGLQIKSVILRDVAKNDYYITDYTYFDPIDHTTVMNLRDYDFQTEYTPSLPLRTNYADRGWTGDNTAGDGTGTATYRWYVPANMRGTDPNNNQFPSEKNVLDNARGATYLYIEGVYGEGHDQGIVYKFYLGENLTDNFDLKPNTSYSYRFTFNGKGNVETDKRIEDYGNINFMVDANSYILNPPLAGMPDRTYTINVVHRPNIFWGTGTATEKNRYGNFSEETKDEYISDTETWQAKILWADFAYDQNAVLTKNTGTGGGTYGSMDQRIKLTIPSDIRQGNMIIGVWANEPDAYDHQDETRILWSWHIWITNYKPDGIAGHTPFVGTHVYKVEGGEVHRYNNAIFNTGRYKDGYIMDRYLGATGQGVARFSYQFGRKDPMPGYFTIYKYMYGESAPYASPSNNQNFDIVPAGPGNGNTGSLQNVPYSVRNPMTFISSNNNAWTSGDIYSGANEWLDPYRTVRSDNEERGKNANKSFFDPCPPGWRVPVNGWAAGFKYGRTDTSDPTATFIYRAEASNGYNRGNDSMTYYPNTYLAGKTTPAETAVFPLGACRQANNGLVYPVTNLTGVWSSNEYALTFYNSGPVNPSTQSTKGTGFAIRCVRE